MLHCCKPDVFHLKWCHKESVSVGWATELSMLVVSTKNFPNLLHQCCQEALLQKRNNQPNISLNALGHSILIQRLQVFGPHGLWLWTLWGLALLKQVANKGTAVGLQVHFPTLFESFVTEQKSSPFSLSQIFLWSFCPVTYKTCWVLQL